MKSPSDTLRGFFRRNRKSVSDAPSAQAQSLPLPALVLEAEKIAASLQSGAHGRRRSGAGEDFWQFRPYHPGEPATSIDWRQSARSPVEDMFWVRERERENAQALMVWCDPSPSMQWRSSENLPTKAERAQLCTLALASAALRGGERAGLLTGLESGRTFGGRQVLPRLAASLLRPPGEEPDFPDMTRAAAKSDLVVISDFLWEESRIDDFLKNCSSRPVRTHLLCILDPAERQMKKSGRIRFEGLEGGVLTLPAMESLGPAYEQAMNTHLTALKQSATARHADCIVHDTSQNPLPALLALHMALGGGR